MADTIARGMSIVNSKKEAMKIAVLHVDHVETTPDGMGIRWVMSDNTTYFDLPLTNLNLIYKTDLSNSTTSTSATTPASSKAVNDLRIASDTKINDVVIELNNYIKIANKSDSTTTNSSTNVATSKAVYDLNQSKVNKTDVSAILANNSAKVAALSLLYELNEKFDDYLLKTNISQVYSDVSTITIPSSYALDQAIVSLEDTYIKKENITDSANGTSKELVLSQYGAKLIKDLISASVTGMKYMGLIDDTGFNALDVWSSGDIYRASDDITFKTVTIPNKSMIIMKTTYVDGTPLDVTDFDYFSSSLEISHTSDEVDKAVTMTLDANLNKLGWVDIDNCSMYCDESTRTIHLLPKVAETSTHCYINAVKVTIDEEKTLQIPDVTGVYYVTLSEAGVLSYVSSYDYNTYSVMPIAFIRWNTTTQKVDAIFDLRVHELDMPVSTRAYLYNLGTQWQSGFDIFNFGLGANNEDSIAKFALTSGVIRLSEKLISYSDVATPLLPYENVMSANAKTKIYYIDGTKYTNTTLSDVCFKMGVTYPVFNKNTDGVFSLEETSNDKYINMFVGVSTDIRPNESLVAIMGQEEFNSIEDARKEKLNVTSIGDLEHRQFHFMYRIIVHISDDYTNSYHAKLVEYNDIRDYALIKTFADENSGGMEALDKIDVVAPDVFTATPNTCYYLKNGSKDAIITLPATGIKEQDQIVFQEIDGILSTLNTVTINGNTASINGESSTVIIDMPYVSCVFEWVGDTWVFKTPGTLIKPNYNDPITFPASTLALPSGNIPIGANPLTPNIGDIWSDGNIKFKQSTERTLYLNTPYVTESQRLAMTPYEGLEVFQTDNEVGQYSYVNGKWESPHAIRTYEPLLTGSVSTPTITSGNWIKGTYHVVGKMMYLNLTYYGNLAWNVSGYYSISMPSGYQIDNATATLPSTFTYAVASKSGGDAMGIGTGMVTGTTYDYSCKVIALSSNSLGCYLSFGNTGDGLTLWGSTVGSINATRCYGNWQCQIPLL